MLLRFVALVFLTGMTIFILLVGSFLGFLASTGVPMSGGSGVRDDQPTTLAQVQHNYQTEFGSLTVDLRHVQFTSVTSIGDRQCRRRRPQRLRAGERHRLLEDPRRRRQRHLHRAQWLRDPTLQRCALLLKTAAEQRQRAPPDPQPPSRRGSHLLATRFLPANSQVRSDLSEPRCGRSSRTAKDVAMVTIEADSLGGHGSTSHEPS